MTPEEIKKINDLFAQIDKLTEENASLSGQLEDKKEKAGRGDPADAQDDV